MARIRTIKPEFWSSERLGAKLAGPDGRQARLLFIALWNHAEDRTGVLRGNPAFLRGAVFPYDDDVTAADVERWLSLLEAGGFIVRYERDGRRYVWVRGFVEHQRIDRPSASTLPEPSEHERNPMREPLAAVRMSESSPRRALDEPSLQEGKGREGSGKEVGAASRGAADAGPPEDLPDATDDAVEDTPPVGPAENGCPDCTNRAPCFKHAKEYAARLKPERPPRQPSAAEALYLRMEGAREETCLAAGQPYVSEEWHAARINKEIGPIAKATEAEREEFLSAFLEYLGDERKAGARVPWSVSLFMQRQVRAEYLTRARRAKQGAA